MIKHDTLGLPLTYGGKPFRAKVVKHGDRGGTNLCIGADGYHSDSYVVLTCTPEDYAKFPVGSLFDLVQVAP